MSVLFFADVFLIDLYNRWLVIQGQYYVFIFLALHHGPLRQLVI